MAATFQPIILGTSTLTINGVAYANQISKAVWTPTSATTTWTAIDGTTFTINQAATWVLEITLAQDFNVPGTVSLSRYLHGAEGTSVVAVFKPIGAEAETVTATITITPGAIGGDTTAIAESTVTMGSTKPVLNAAT
jgi:hypothetical protein